jgi:DNA repair photolyase
MSKATVHEIFDRIKELPQEDRHLLDELLNRLDEEEWQREVVAERRKAREQNFDQAVIDQAVAQLRYGT